MRTPDILIDGWCLEDGEERHRVAPATFPIPELSLRQALQPGDLAKLIFRIAIEGADSPEAVERMWVIVSRRTATGYMGILDNEPSEISENDAFRRGSELPFEPYQIIAVGQADDASRRIARSPAGIPWADT